LPEGCTFLRIQIFLFILIEQNQQMDMITALQIQIPVPKSSALSFPPPGVAAPRLAYSTQSLNHASTLGIREQVILNGTQDSLRVVTRQLS